MAGTPLGDIPGARFTIPAPVGTHASVASNGATAQIGGLVGPLPHDARLRLAWWIPTGADNSASSTASYRALRVYNGGTAGTVTASTSRLASLALTASAASRGPVAMVVDTTVTIASGSVLYFSQDTVGGADSNGTVLVAGQFALSFEVI